MVYRLFGAIVGFFLLTLFVCADKNADKPVLFNANAQVKGIFSLNKKWMAYSESGIFSLYSGSDSLSISHQLQTPMRPSGALAVGGFNRVYAAGAYGEACLIDLAAEKTLKRIFISKRIPLSCIAVDKAQTMLLAGDRAGRLHLRKLPSGGILREINPAEGQSALRSLVFSKDDSSFFAAFQKTEKRSEAAPITMRRTADGIKIRDFEASDFGVINMGLTGPYLIAATDQGFAAQYDYSTGRMLKTYYLRRGAITAMAVCAKTNTVALGDDRGGLDVVDAKEMKKKYRTQDFGDDRSPVIDLVFYDEGGRLAVCKASGKVYALRVF